MLRLTEFFTDDPDIHIPDFWEVARSVRMKVALLRVNPSFIYCTRRGT